ncbi:hypothetical protein BDW74DRAFT_186936 [Aspergillus multicolor]|uniref:uncharacterized protein n=1 Tax=Aspergillus multicolor TaxID=41759 RepID=UPI003CCD1317
MATREASNAALNTLDKPHFETLESTVRHILATEQAEYVVAQVAEGLPIKETAKYKNHCDVEDLDNRTQPGLKALDLVRSWRWEFDLGSLEVESNQTSFEAREFKPRLMEITAVPLYKKPPPKHKIITVDGWSQRTDELIPSRVPTYLYHNDYLDVYLHPDARFKVFKLSDAQIDQFINFGLHGEPSVPSPFPNRPEILTVRLFTAVFKLFYNIYRSRNDRKVREINTARMNWGGRIEDDPLIMEFIEERKRAEQDQENSQT